MGVLMDHQVLAGPSVTAGQAVAYSVCIFDQSWD